MIPLFQNNIFNEIVTKYRENRLAHAYLIETNNLLALEKDLKELIKIINCPNTYTDNCNDCNLCHLINQNSIPSLKIIEPDGAFIKKNQIEELKINFSTIPVYSRYNTYIIKNAEKLNPSSANAMLKFLEEPEEKILGFFLTTNKDIMLDTIKSRCNILTINYDAGNIIDNLNIDEEQYETYKQEIKIYLANVNSDKLINHKQDILTKFKERIEITTLFKIIFNIYYHKYLELISKPYDKKVLEIYNPQENLSRIIKKLQIITKTLNDMSYNVSIELILDKFVIEMRGTNE